MNIFANPTVHIRVPVIFHLILFQHFSEEITVGILPGTHYLSRHTLIISHTLPSISIQKVT